MLRDAERRTIERLATHSPDPRAASVEALKVAQQGHGFISDELLGEVAALLGISEAALDAVATFYNLLFRQGVGDHAVLVCDSVSCWLTGLDELVAAFQEQYGIAFGETTDDGRFTLLPVPCLGACDGAPAMMVDDDLYRNVRPEDLGDILAAYAARDQARDQGDR
jgi:NADH-quinone oxidoreductase subunit E